MVYEDQVLMHTFFYPLGVGYHLVMVKESSCNPDIVTNAVTKFVTGATKESDIGSELSYLLPREESSHFEELFSFLENNKENVGISSFGVSVTTMEEVFVK